jgi:hypothetical protein
MWGDGPPRRSSPTKGWQWAVLVILILGALFGIYMAGKTGIPYRPHAPRHSVPSSTGAPR